MNADQLTDTVFEIAKHTYEAKEAAYTPKIMRELERVVMLRWWTNTGWTTSTPWTI